MVWSMKKLDLTWLIASQVCQELTGKTQLLPHCAEADVPQAQAVTAEGRRCSGTRVRGQPRFLWKPAVYVS